MPARAVTVKQVELAMIDEHFTLTTTPPAHELEPLGRQEVQQQWVGEAEIWIAISYHMRHVAKGSIELPPLASLVVPLLVAVWHSGDGRVYQDGVGSDEWAALLQGLSGAAQVEL
jgi:hypothetical protein